MNALTLRVITPAWTGTPAKDPSWLDYGRCTQVGGNAHHAEHGDPERSEAIKVCKGAPGKPGCPVRAACLQYGLAEKRGVWGGLTPSGRRRIRVAAGAATRAATALALELAAAQNQPDEMVMAA